MKGTTLSNDRRICCRVAGSSLRPKIVASAASTAMKTATAGQVKCFIALSLPGIAKDTAARCLWPDRLEPRVTRLRLRPEERLADQ
jgi:hypothetical protein